MRPLKHLKAFRQRTSFRRHARHLASHVFKESRGQRILICVVMHLNVGCALGVHRISFHPVRSISKFPALEIRDVLNFWRSSLASVCLRHDVRVAPSQKSYVAQAFPTSASGTHP